MDPGRRGFLREMVAAAAARLECVPEQEEPVFGFRDRTIGVAAVRDGSRTWLRVTAAPGEAASGDAWTGNRDMRGLAGVPRPEPLARLEWPEGELVVCAELMTYVPPRVVSATSELRADPGLPDSWWTALRRSVHAVEACRTGRSCYREELFRRALLTRFGRWVRVPERIEWRTAHCDLHWANLTSPELAILDWEYWGTAPAGLDAATLYCHSLLVPAVAERVRQSFADVLESPTGRLTQLAVVDQLLNREEGAAEPDARLVLALCGLADRLLRRAAG